jgi:hypothetical protein
MFVMVIGSDESCRVHLAALAGKDFLHRCHQPFIPLDERAVAVKSEPLGFGSAKSHVVFLILILRGAPLPAGLTQAAAIAK